MFVSVFFHLSVHLVLLINVDRLNDKHKALIGIMEEIYVLNQQKAHRNHIEQTMDKLVVFSGKHFLDEEQYMQTAGYGETGSHKLLHRELLLDLKNEVENYKTLSGDEVPDTFFSFLHRWVIVHIKGSDGRFANIGAQADT
ncbi:hemerythrin domain-containing protein [Kaarinaea lacus]